MSRARDEVRARCGRAAAGSALAAALVGFAVVPGSLRLPLGVAAAAYWSAAWSAALFRPRTKKSTRFAGIVRTLSPKSLVSMLLAGLAGAVLAFSRLDSPFTRPCLRDPKIKCLEEINLMLVAAGLWNGLYYFVREFVQKEPSLNFPPIHQKKFIQIKSAVWSTLKRAGSNAVAPALSFAVLYWWNGSRLRNPVLDLFGLEIDFQTRAFSFQTLFILWFHSALFLFAARFTVVLFDVFLTQRMQFPIEKLDGRSTTLAQELSGNDEILVQLASRDLFYVSHESDARRKTIFSLSQPGGHPTNWKQIFGACIGIVNAYADDVEELLAGEAKSEMSTKPDSEIQSPKAPLRIANPAMRSLSLTSPKIREKPFSPPAKSFKRAAAEELTALLTAIRNKPGISFLFGELTDARIESVAHKGQTVSKVSLGLSSLAAASIREDMFGVVQDDLPIIIRSLLRLKRSLDRLTKSGMVNRKNFKHDTAAMRLLTEVKSAVKRSIYKITVTFANYMDDIILDSDTIINLQPFIQMREG